MKSDPDHGTSERLGVAPARPEHLNRIRSDLTGDLRHRPATAQRHQTAIRYGHVARVMSVDRGEEWPVPIRSAVMAGTTSFGRPQRRVVEVLLSYPAVTREAR